MKKFLIQKWNGKEWIDFICIYGVNELKDVWSVFESHFSEQIFDAQAIEVK